MKSIVSLFQVLAYTRVGDGALSSPPLQERTYEDVPGQSRNLFKTQIYSS